MIMKNSAAIFLTSSLILLLQTLHGVKAGFICVGSSFPTNSSYQKNRDSLFSTLSDKVTTNGGFYNASLDGVHVVGLCRRDYDRQGCINCVEESIRQIKTSCSNRVQSFHCNSDDRERVSCLVRTTDQSTYRILELGPATNDPSPVAIDTFAKNMTLFRQEWEAMVDRTLEAVTIDNSTTVLKYYGALKSEFSEFPNVYMMMQCTPDINSGACKRCLQASVTYFRDQNWGRQGGGICRPSCVFRWEFYPFYGAFANVTRVPAPPRALIPRTEAISITRLKGGIIAIFVVPIVINLLVFIGLIRAYTRIRKSYNGINEAQYDYGGQSKLRFDFRMILTATDDFSFENKIGQGGFGSVYKGKLPGGEEIAVKRLTRGSGQGEIEFRNEVLLLTRLQHRNLVKLLGFCNEGDEEILVYEFVPNSSLDHFIFDEEKRLLLTWDMRARIIEGVARGLVYLHEDSQLRIIHRDLKASNILLDAYMNPKVADFGMARLFNMDQTRAVTRKVVGTFGYMAPEYVRNRTFSVKTDVYSFGVVLLEMITGRSNKNYFEALGLPAYAWKCWVAGEAASIIDHVLSRSRSNEIMRFIHIGLLCVQENVSKRPTMSLVIQWLGSETIAIPLPTVAGFTNASYQAEHEAGTLSLNELSITELSPR
ncbi:cysteine-rich RLK (RECEPTOR-like protein kinase) 38 [Arabidopsis thaliana]|nr:cysteine-rich RLK (RECEPTOR-like protein kinase) 38 [Arabidopsis thaliana]ANM66867.1 cysteine-rich RLK (RECEPTOR-like protein kinase) 38 [Arabidopsis thaliana]|eukprot:NP_001328736.1 cysteine-rich RLK (RECEPTOR-like protein kinase) 38 [Arabidopsis thaliana]